MSLRSNLKHLMDKGGYNPHSLAAATGVKQPTIFRILEGESLTPRDSTVRPLAEFFNVSIEQLRYGSFGIEPSNIELGPKIRGRVPLISWIQAGDWCETIDTFQPGDAEDWMVSPSPHSDRAYALRVKGPSMEPRFHEGEIIIVDPDASPDPGRFVIAKKTGNGDATFKQLLEEGGVPYLKALNPDWPTPIIRLDESWHICGVVICKVEMF